LGVITGRKIGGAVIRNRARRLMREAFRGNRHLLKHPLDLVLVARGSIADKKKDAVERDLILILKQEGLLNPSE
jgi:ribonuclease P protein component